MTGALASLPRTSPYQGLRNYDEEDSEFFFGRDHDRDVIIANLKASRLTIVYGPSGVGKSSLLRAGVEAWLARAAATSYSRVGTPEFVPVVFSAWQEDPVRGLAAAVAAAVERITGEPLQPGRSLADTIAAGASASDATLLIILDQFEELSLYQPGRNGGRSFDAELARLVADRRLAVNFLISLREDCLADLDRFRATIPNLLANRVRVHPLSRAAAREAIVRPIERYNELAAPTPEVTIEDELVEAVLDQVRTGLVTFEGDGHGRVSAANGSETGQADAQIETPYLQLVMEKVWEREIAQGSHVLRRSTLSDMGEATEIVRTHLDGALGELPPEQREAAVDVFDHLVTPSGTKIALRLPDLVAYSHRPSDQVEALVETLSSGPQRILRPVPPPPGVEGRPGVEIFHDVLAPAILAWRTRQTAERLKREKQEADERARNERRRARLFSALLAGAVALLLVAIAAVVFAEVNRAQADSARKTAQSGQLAAQAGNDFRQGRLGRALLLSIEAYRTAATPLARAALVEGLESTQGMDAYFSGQSGAINAVAFSPDGRTLASGSTDKSIALWDISNGHLLHTLRGHGDAVNAVAFNRDGDMLASASTDQTVSLWDVARGRRLRTLGGHAGELYTIAFNPDSTVVAAAGADGTIRLWDPSTGRSIRSLHAPSAVNSIAFGPSGAILASAQDDGAVIEWDVRTGRLLHRLVGHTGAATALSFSPDGAELASASADHTIRLWRAGTGQSLGVLHGHTAPINAVAFSPNGQQLVSGGADHAVALWNVASRHLVRFISTDTGSIVESVAFSPGGRSVATGSDAGSVVLWAATPAGGARTLLNPSPVYSVAFSPRGRELAAAGGNGNVALWNAGTGRLISTLTGDTRAVNGVAFGPAGKSLAGASDDGSVSIWDLATGRRRVLAGGAGQLYGVAFNPAGTQVAAAGAGGSVLVWDLASGKRRAFSGDGSALYSVAFSPNGRIIATGGADGLVTTWDAETGRRLHTLTGHTAAVESVAFSPDGTTLASGSDDDTVILWDPIKGRALGDPLRGHIDGVLGVAFAPNGRTLASAARDNTAIVWNLDTRLGQPVGGHSDNVTSVAFNPRDGSLATGGIDRTVVLFTTLPSSSTAGPIDTRMCSVVRHNLTQADWHEFLPDRPYQLTCPTYR